MLRTLTVGLLLLAVVRGAAADEPVTAPGAPAAAASAAGSTPSADAARARAKTPAAAKPATDARTDPAASTDQAAPKGDVKMSGMSILGNEDAPKSLALVPWKSSQLGDMPSVSRLLDSAAQPVDKDVFMRELA